MTCGHPQGNLSPNFYVARVRALGWKRWPRVPWPTSPQRLFYALTEYESNRVCDGDVYGRLVCSAWCLVRKIINQSLPLCQSLTCTFDTYVLVTMALFRPHYPYIIYSEIVKTCQTYLHAIVSDVLYPCMCYDHTMVLCYYGFILLCEIFVIEMRIYQHIHSPYVRNILHQHLQFVNRKFHTCFMLCYVHCVWTPCSILKCATLQTTPSTNLCVGCESQCTGNTKIVSPLMKH